MTRKGATDANMLDKLFGKKNELGMPDTEESDKATAEAAAARLAGEADVKQREDRVGRYLKKYMDKMVFSEFSDSYMRNAGIYDLMKGVPVPLRREDKKVFQGGSGLKAMALAENMAWVMGIDPHFKYTEHYVAFLLKLFNPKICDGILKKGRNLAEQNELDQACIFFRATLCINPTYMHGMYSYARVCRAMYLEGQGEKYIGRLKAEALDYFELLTEIHPRFAQAYYYLGYAYLNMGLYVKTQLAWQQFLKRSTHPKDKKEIKERLSQIEEPVEIEQGYNAVLAGRYKEGLFILEPFLQTRFKTWWPLSYYLGVCYARTGNDEKAIESFKRVLKMNGSHLETMEELVELYANMQDNENEEKYRKKIELIRKNIGSEQES